MLYRWHVRCGQLSLHRSFTSILSPSTRHKSCNQKWCQSRFLVNTAGRQKGLAVPTNDNTLRQRRKDTIPTADTIYALSTAAGRAAIAVIRVSGPACLDIYGAICPNRAFPHPRMATLRKLKDPNNPTRVLDTGALVLYFPAPSTVTGYDVLEFHVHGGPAVVRSVLEAIPHCSDSRPRRRTSEYSLIRAAEPGEFTKQAFYNGRLDLTQAEALGETLAAETEQQRQLAVAGADSRLASRYEEWRKTLMYARGELEALIDFSEDQHFDESPAKLMRSVAVQVDELSRQIKLHIDNAGRGELLRSGISVALLGEPNVGKSSLLNLIAGRDAAIVSPEAGTTRDIVDVSVDIAGWLIKLGDMAGLRGNGNDCRNFHVDPRVHAHAPIGQVEQEGIRRARQRALQSDLVIVIASLTQQGNGAIELSIDQELITAAAQCHAAGKAMAFVVNKVDILSSEGRAELASGLRQRILDTFPAAATDNVFFLSCKDAVSSSSPTPTLGSSSASPRLSDPGGVQTLLTGLSHIFRKMTSALTESDPKDTPINTNMSPAELQSYWTTSLSVTHRQSVYLQHCRAHLDDFLAQSTTPRSVDMSLELNHEHHHDHHHDHRNISSHHVDGHDDLVGENDAAGEQLHPSDQDHIDVVTAAEHLRYAADCLARITGRGDSGDVEDVLGVVFEKFCVGK